MNTSTLPCQSSLPPNEGEQIVAVVGAFGRSRRNSSLELLRIICILLILANHYSVLGGIPARGWRDLTWGYFFVQSIGMFGRTACSVFVLITGYYLSTGVKPGHWKKAIPLAAEAVFYSRGSKRREPAEAGGRKRSGGDFTDAASLECVFYNLRAE